MMKNNWSCIWILNSLFLSILLLNKIGVLCSQECSFNNGKCTYEIKLTQADSQCETRNTKTRQIQERDPYSQNDNEMTKMQRDFHTVTEQHKNRIEELEASVQKLLRSAVPPRAENVQVTSRRAEDDNIFLIAKSEPNTTETGLLKRLYDEFSVLRTRLYKRTSTLLDSEKKLNETSNLFIKAQSELAEQVELLSISEHKAATLEQERYILKNKVKHTSEQLEDLQIKFNASSAHIVELEDKLYTVVRSESNLKEELGLYKWKLNKAEKAHAQLQANYSVVKQALNKTQLTLDKTEFDLMECLTAKTQSFCGFEDDKICGYQQEVEGDDFDWTRNVGKTASGGTGPSTDHTCGEPKSGHYMYIEASGRNSGRRAVLISPKYRGLKAQCFSFYYHMHGSHVGTLNVYTTTDSENELNSVWRAFGNQGDVWIKATLSIPKELSRAGYRVKFEAITRSGYQGDISIDDVTVEDGKCHGNSIEVKYDKNEVIDHYDQNIKRYKKFKDKIRKRNG